MVNRLTTAELLKEKEVDLLKAWRGEVRIAAGRTFQLMTEAQFDEQARKFLADFVAAISSERYDDLSIPEYVKVKGNLAEISANRAKQGFTPTETATFIFSLKNTILQYLQDYIKDPKVLNTEAIVITKILDQLGLYTFEIYMKTREDIINSQKMSLEYSTPTVLVWSNLVLFPLLGVLDTARMKQLTETMLQGIIQNQAEVVIVDLTGISAVDTKTVHRLLQIIQSAKLMGSEVIFTGITPAVAETMVRLGVELGGLTTLRELREGIEYAFKVMKLKVVKEE